MAVFLIIALVAAAITKSVTNYRLDREYARQGLDSPRYKVRLAKLAAAGLPPSGAAVARPGAKGYFRALWDDAWEDLTDRHTRIREQKKAGERPTVGQRVGAAYRWAKSPIGEREAAEAVDDAQRPAERPAPAPAVEPTAGQPKPDGPVITCPDCGVALRDVDGRWIHRPDSPCRLAATERQGQDSAPRSSVVHDDLDYVPGPHQTDPNYEGGPDPNAARRQRDTAPDRPLLNDHANPKVIEGELAMTTATVEVNTNEDARAAFTAMHEAATAAADAINALEIAKAKLAAAANGTADGMSGKRFDSLATEAATEAAEIINVGTLAEWTERFDSVAHLAKRGVEALDKYLDSESLVAENNIDASTLAPSA